MSFYPIGINRKRTDIHKAFKATVARARFEKVSCRHHGVHERIGIGFFASACSQVKNDRRALGRSQAILGRQKISCDQFDARSVSGEVGERVDANLIAGWSGKAPYVLESKTQQGLY